MSIAKKAYKSQVFRFLLVGGFCAGVEFLLFALLVHYYQVDYLFANGFSLLVAVMLNYFISRKYVFDESKYSVKVEFSAFFIFSTVGVILNQYLLWNFVEQMEINVNISKALAIVLVAAFNFLTKKYIVFRK
ncbi:GtrA family protein [Pontibacter toksunensis]|uniref:GtrA family protein n=1 Tax=Pontibacter toksunensis TaxID=1332631 RepID=A0ABW6BV19_9BACT